MPCSGRTSAASNSGSPTGALSTASASRHTASVSGGSESPWLRIADPPKGRSTSSRSGASSASTRFAEPITSGPMQSPARQATRGLGREEVEELIDREATRKRHDLADDNERRRLQAGGCRRDRGERCEQG